MTRARRTAHPRPTPALCELNTKRLTLRPPGVEDAEAIHGFTRDPQTSRFLGWAPHKTLGETRAYLRRCQAAWEHGRRLPWVIVDENGAPIGLIEVQFARAMAGIGYVLAPEAWGRGYATEALAAVCAAVFAETTVPSVWAVCDVENPASARVLEKCRFTRRARLPAYRTCPNIGPEPRDFFSYALQRGEHPAPEGMTGEAG